MAKRREDAFSMVVTVCLTNLVSEKSSEVKRNGKN